MPFGLGMGELVMILVIVTVVFGATNLLSWRRARKGDPELQAIDRAGSKDETPRARSGFRQYRRDVTSCHTACELS